ncbi:DNA glycosylase [Phlegmacium glaucopus]|nr:DNA glycosylase [Phlegmacium glaucopus]
MSALKRTLSSPTQLTSHVSQHNASVTLFQLSSSHESDIENSPRRSKRIKRQEPECQADLNNLTHNILADKPRKSRNAGVNATASGSAIPRTSKGGDVQASPKKFKAIAQSLAVPHPPPSAWKETYDTIKDMRSRFVAPVDTMGCDRAQFKETDPKNRRYATLVSLMLSSQTKDEVTDAAVSKLRSALGGSLSVQGMIDAEEEAIAEAIAKVGFWRRKTGYLKEAAIKLRDEFDSDVPKTVDELCSLPGVGPKMAFLALQIAWNLNHGIGVDVHVHRITNLLRWHKPPTKNPEQTRLNLQSWLPKELHGEINHLLVGFGQVICLPVGPRCDVCDLSTKGLCPSAQKVVNAKNRKTIVFSTPGEGADPKLEVKLEEEIGEEMGLEVVKTEDRKT